MEIFALVLLSVSACYGFATQENKPKFKMNSKKNDDPDAVFMQPYDTTNY